MTTHKLYTSTKTYGSSKRLTKIYKMIKKNNKITKNKIIKNSNKYRLKVIKVLKMTII